MNKKIYRVIILIVAAVITTSSIIAVKYGRRKNELQVLQEKKDQTESYNKIFNESNVKVGNTRIDGNKIESSSDDVTKKKRNGKDFTGNNTEINIYKNVSSNLSNNEVELLARLINSEAGSQSMAGKVAVANVVLYRARQNNQSISQVIYSKNQFDGVGTNNFNCQPTCESMEAAIKALNGVTIVDDGYFYANLNLCNPSWAKEKTFICRIGDHWFFKK